VASTTGEFAPKKSLDGAREDSLRTEQMDQIEQIDQTKQIEQIEQIDQKKKETDRDTDRVTHIDMKDRCSYVWCLRLSYLYV